MPFDFEYGIDCKDAAEYRQQSSFKLESACEVPEYAEADGGKEYNKAKLRDATSAHCLFLWKAALGSPTIP